MHDGSSGSASAIRTCHVDVAMVGQTPRADTKHEIRSCRLAVVRLSWRTTAGEMLLGKCVHPKRTLVDSWIFMDYGLYDIAWWKTAMFTDMLCVRERVVANLRGEYVAELWLAMRITIPCTSN